jgi:hypothetical protein
LRAAVLACGGYKKVGAAMRPELPIAQAEAWVRHCLDESRREKFCPEQVLLILRMAHQIGFHAAMDFLAADTGYKATPVDMKAQVQSLEERIESGMQALNASMATLARLKERQAQQ